MTLLPARRFKAVTAARMRALDRHAIDHYGVPGAALMENAGAAVAAAYAKFFPKGSVAVLCGPGNNGGDGFVAARHLMNRGYAVRLVLSRRPTPGTDADIHWQSLRRLAVPLFFAAGVAPASKKLVKFFLGCRGAIDALLGTGAAGELKEPVGALVGFLNAWHRPVLAVDIPSGLDADTGRPAGQAVKARMTVTLGLPKRGLVAPGAARWTGRVFVADIGYPFPLWRPFIKGPKHF